ncbi:unnamed protein product [Mytilus edulis]|uniref:Uncharacterized protein n=1 Tax=Mytilus edulis TaxID=6550 RepID=A0A8S3TGV8_MYTED|nr:unnamed protein product [Mytilus edulis]
MLSLYLLIGYAHIIGTICTYLIILLLVSLVFVSLTCICWKYEYLARRERSIFHTNSTHPNESGNNPPQVETHHSIEQFCCFNYEFRDGRCVECENGFFTNIPDEPCRPCPHNTFGRKCFSICQCNINERCDHVNGECLKVLPSTETGTTNDNFERIDDSKIPLPSIIVTSTVLILLVFVSVIWVLLEI